MFRHRGRRRSVTPRRCFAAVALAPLLLAGPGPAARAETVAASAAFPVRYRVLAAGLTVLEIDARVEIAAESYRLSARLRTRGLAALTAPGEQVSEAAGELRGTEPLPARFLSDGRWRGRARRVVLDWLGAEPVLRLRDPPAAAEEREPVPPELRRGTLDALSAMMRLARIVAATGRCEPAAAAIYDGRRRTDYVLRTAGREVLPRGRDDAWAGEALRCGFEGRQVAGFRHDEAPAERGRPQHGTAWLAPLAAGGLPVPVRLEVPTRWLGTVEAYLVTTGGAAAASR